VQANLTRGLAQTKRFSIYDQPRPQSQKFLEGRR